LAAQLQATLADESGLPDIELIDQNGPVTVPDVQQPRLARTNGSALAIMDDELFRAAGNELRPLRPAVSTYGLDPTALAVASGRDGLVVVRDGHTRLVRLERQSAEDAAPETASADGVENDFPAVPPLTPTPGLTALEPPATPLGPEAEPVEPAEVNGSAEVNVSGIAEADVLLEGTDLIAPSIDMYSVIWSGETAGPIVVIIESGGEYEVSAPWLAGRAIDSLRVAPDGVRVAVISTELDVDGEPVGESAIHVAGIRRDAQHVPLSLDQPKQVGGSLREVSSAVWQDDATLAVIARANSGGEPAIFWVGVGGLDAPGGLPQAVPGISSPIALTASVGTGNMLVIDPESILHLRQSSSLWPSVGQPVTLVAYPG
jgi:hypothetical protein